MLLQVIQIFQPRLESTLRIISLNRPVTSNENSGNMELLPIKMPLRFLLNELLEEEVSRGSTKMTFTNILSKFNNNLYITRETVKIIIMEESTERTKVVRSKRWEIGKKQWNGPNESKMRS